MEEIAEDNFILTDVQKKLLDDELEKIKNDAQYLLDWTNVKHTLKVG